MATIPQTYKPEIIPKHGFPVPTNPDFQTWIKSMFDYEKKNKRNLIKLFNHQRLVRDYMQIRSPYRGILLYTLDH